MDNKKIMERIAKLANKTVENGCTMDEALAASKMVQKFIAKYHIDMTEYKEEQEKIEKESISYTRKWVRRLISCLADNYCCEWVGNSSEKKIFIMGRDTDRKTCLAMFNMFYPLIKKGIQEAKREAREKFGTTKDVEALYSIGYIKAIRQELEKQCRALALVIPQEVTEQFHKEFDVKVTHTSIRYNANVGNYAQNKGYNDGMEASKTKAIA